MIITSANLDALRTEFKTGWQDAYNKAETYYTRYATEISSSTKSNTYGWVSQMLKLRQWVGPRVAQNLSEHSYVLSNVTFEGTVEVGREEIEDDNLGVYAGQMIPQLGEATRKHPDVLFTGGTAGLFNVNPLGFDNVAFFNSAHPTFDDAGDTYSNDFTTAALTPANFNAAWAAMASYVGEDGQVMGVSPNVLMVPPQLKLAALQIMQGTLAASPPGIGGGTNNVAIDNGLRGWAEVVVNPYLAYAPTVWYLMDLSKMIKPFIFQKRRAPEFVSRDNPNDPVVFDRNKFVYGVDYRAAAGVSLPFLCSRNTA